MIIDLLITPTDTLVLGAQRRTCNNWVAATAPMLAPASWLSPALGKILGPCVDPSSPVLFAREQGGRVEPLFPAPDDLVADERHKDFIYMQPAYLEPVRSDVVLHSLQPLRLLVSSTRKRKIVPLGGYLTRKGMRAWAERKVERFSEGEHYVLPRKLADFERVACERRSEFDWIHARFRLGAGILVSVSVEDTDRLSALPCLTELGAQHRMARVEAVQVPQIDLRQKPGRRWRLVLLAPEPATADGLPIWADPSDLSLRDPMPEGGRLTAIAANSGSSFMVHHTHAGPDARMFRPGTTFFVEFSEPVRIDPPSSMFAGGT